MAYIKSILLLLEQHRVRLSDAAAQIRLLHPFRRLGGPCGPPLLHGGGALIRHGGGLRAGPDGVGEDVHGGKAAFLDKRQRLGELLLRFAGEAGDQVGGDGRAVKVLPQQRHGLIEPGGVVFAVHAAQRVIAAGLHGQVEVRAQVGQPCRPAAEVLGDGAGL